MADRSETVIAQLGLTNEECALIHASMRDRQSKLRLLVRNARDNGAEEHARKLEAEALLTFRIQGMIEHRDERALPCAVGQEY